MMANQYLILRFYIGVLTYAKNFDVLIFEHPEEPSLSDGGIINQGLKSLELKGFKEYRVVVKV